METKSDVQSAIKEFMRALLCGASYMLVLKFLTPSLLRGRMERYILHLFTTFRS